MFTTIHGNQLHDIHGGDGNRLIRAHVGMEGTGWQRFANTMTSNIGVGLGVGVVTGGTIGGLTTGVGAVPGAGFGALAGLAAGTTTGLTMWGLESYRRGGISR